jgi:hypothetical protein
MLGINHNNIILSQLVKVTMTMPFNLVGFWNIRGSYVIFVALWAMIMISWHYYYKKDSFGASEYVGSFFMFVFIYL